MTSSMGGEAAFLPIKRGRLIRRLKDAGVKVKRLPGWLSGPRGPTRISYFKRGSSIAIIQSDGTMKDSDFVPFPVVRSICTQLSIDPSTVLDPAGSGDPGADPSLSGLLPC